MLGQFLGAAGVGNADIRCDEDVRRAWIAIGWQSRRVVKLRDAGPEKIWPMPAILFVVGDCVSSIATALSVVQVVFSQTRETSSSVGPMPVGLDGDSEKGKQPPASKIVARRRRYRASGDAHVACGIDRTLAVLRRNDDQRRIEKAIASSVRQPSCRSTRRRIESRRADQSVGVPVAS